MLQMARAADPDRIAEQERAYMSIAPGFPRVVEGSLAATIGESRSDGSIRDSDVPSDESDRGEDEDDEAMDMDMDD